MALGGFVPGSLILYLKGMRRMMFQLSGFYRIMKEAQGWAWYRPLRSWSRDLVSGMNGFRV